MILFIRVIEQSFSRQRSRTLDRLDYIGFYYFHRLSGASFRWFVNDLLGRKSLLPFDIFLSHVMPILLQGIVCFSFVSFLSIHAYRRSFVVFDNSPPPAFLYNSKSHLHFSISLPNTFQSYIHVLFFSSCSLSLQSPLECEKQNFFLSIVSIASRKHL